MPQVGIVSSLTYGNKKPHVILSFTRVVEVVLRPERTSLTSEVFCCELALDEGRRVNSKSSQGVRDFILSNPETFAFRNDFELRAGTFFGSFVERKVHSVRCKRETARSAKQAVNSLTSIIAQENEALESGWSLTNGVLGGRADDLDVDDAHGRGLGSEEKEGGGGDDDDDDEQKEDAEEAKGSEDLRQATARSEELRREVHLTSSVLSATDRMAGSLTRAVLSVPGAATRGVAAGVTNPEGTAKSIVASMVSEKQRAVF